MLYCIDLKTSVVHVLGCPHIRPKKEEKCFLSRFNSANDAVTDAKSKGYSEANGCFHCCSSTHIK